MKENLAEMFHGGTDELVFWAFRYFLGRQTNATIMFATDLALAWHMLSQKTQKLIKRELEKAFAGDDEARAAGKNSLPLGWDLDRASWQKVRDKYLQPQAEGEVVSAER